MSRDERRCPYCLEACGDQTGLFNAGAQPQEGDVSICFYCAEVSAYTADGGIRKPEPKEMDLFMVDPRVLIAQAHIRERIGGKTAH